MYQGCSGYLKAIRSIPGSWRCRAKCSCSLHECRFVNCFEWSKVTSGATLFVIGWQWWRGLSLLHSVSVHEGRLFEVAVCGPQGAGLQRRHWHGVQLPGRPVVCGRPWFRGMAIVVQVVFSFFNEQDRFYFRLDGNGNVCQATTQYRAWMYEHQVGGFYQQFGNLTFLTVKVTPFIFYFPP